MSPTYLVVVPVWVGTPTHPKKSEVLFNLVNTPRAASSLVSQPQIPINPLEEATLARQHVTIKRFPLLCAKVSEKR
jgi:hypothetical protein